MKSTTKLILKAGRDKPVRQRHPWIFSGAIDKLVGSPNSGQTVDVLAADGSWLARAGYSPASQIRARVWTWDAAENVDDDFWQRRLASAIARRAWMRKQSNALRLVAAEADLLPGLIVDQYADYLVVQFLTAAADAWRTSVVSALQQICQPAGILERSDVEVRALEGLPSNITWLAGTPPTTPIIIWEALPNGNTLQLAVDLQHGHKTGLYLDQRTNRSLLAGLAQHLNGGTVLNTYAYTGGFGIAALLGGAQHVINIDSAADVLALGAQNLALNGLAAERADWVVAGVPHQLRLYRDQARQFDAIVLDPPKFVQNQGQLEKATRAYKDINLQAFNLLAPGGWLLTFSCSGLLSPDLFQKIVFGAALDAGKAVQIVQYLGQAPDHPVLLSVPEGQYLKGLLCRVL
jgi:23S rRNA (cytosine1962-C5)-methyltransferase